jgi:hypothetical protein
MKEATCMSGHDLVLLRGEPILGGTGTVTMFYCRRCGKIVRGH